MRLDTHFQEVYYFSIKEQNNAYENLKLICSRCTHAKDVAATCILTAVLCYFCIVKEALLKDIVGGSSLIATIYDFSRFAVLKVAVFDLNASLQLCPSHVVSL